MFESICPSQLSAFLFVLLIIFLILIVYDNYHSSPVICSQDLIQPPSPRALPILGHLHLLAGYQVPYQAFTELGKKYGSVVKLRLGSVNSVVVNGPENIRDILVTKGHHFDSRPNFERYQQLFCGNKENSLAFCDWSDTQKTRRDMLRVYTFPRAFTNKFSSLENIVSAEMDALVSKIPDQDFEIKQLILQTCASIFTNHFCSKSFGPSDAKFVEMVNNFDEIFYEVNQGYAADFLPFLMPFHQKHLVEMNSLTHKIREFILECVIGNRFDDYSDEEPSDYVESVIQYVKTDSSPKITWDMALFALEDILGGHSAVGNFLVKVFAFLVNEPDVQKKIQDEIDGITREGDGFRKILLSDKSRMPYTEGSLFEAIRLIASPIVPRVANQNSSVNGYFIEKGTVIFLNNYDLSMSEKLWSEPEKFKPERFVLNGRFVKPDHFLPFGGGRRSCMGYKMVQLVGFGIVSSLLQNFTILPSENRTYKVPIGSLALPAKTFSFRFSKR